MAYVHKILTITLNFSNLRNKQSLSMKPILPVQQVMRNSVQFTELV